MKSRYLSAAALVLALGAAAIAPGGASAAPARGPRLITIRVQPNPIVAGDPVVIFGRLIGRRDQGRLVVLYHRAAFGGGTFVPVQSTRTDTMGAYEFSRADGNVDTNRSWYVTSAGLTSRTVNERVAALVTIAATGPGGVSEPDGSVLQTGKGELYTFAGTDTPGKPGARVLLQRQASTSGPDNWVTIGRGRLDVSGAYSIVHKFVIPSATGGDANIRVLVPNDVKNIASPSETLSYEIEQTQNPNLTIVPKSYVILEGTSDTISGVDAAGASQTVTLYSHQAGQPFAAIETTISGAGGAYSFSVSPEYNTYYRVTSSPVVVSASKGSTGTTGTSGSTGTTGSTGPGSAKVVSSAVAFVGVRVVLTVQTTSTTINQGQSVTFSGTLFPDETGRVIRLERENAAGTAWHTIATTVVATGSSYSLSWMFYEVGSETVRIAINGSPANQGAATPPITITVNAIPAAQLAPATG
ncbi:MAG: hypothetical protein ABSG64_07525 [Solirubrobacteraceae bacterium]